MAENNNKQEVEEPKPDCCTRFKTGCSNAGRFLYNPETHEVLGRTGLSWLKILSFYLGFYAFLAGFFAACMVVFIQTLDPVAPTMQKMYSLMKDNPGMNFEPFPDTTHTLISINSSNASYSQYLSSLHTVNEKNLNTSNSNKLKQCHTYDGATPDQACDFNFDKLAPNSSCTESNEFGYGDGMPCVMLRINRVYLWEPNNATFDSSNYCKTGPKDSGCTNKEAFDALPDHVKSNVSLGNIAISCEGENDGDMDNINKVHFYPADGIPAYFFPFYNQPGYISPYVMAQFDVKRGVAVMVWCKFWTKNVIFDRIDLQGSIHLEVFVDFN